MGGPGSANDQFTDDRSAYGTNEPGCDYVSGFVGAAARLAQEYGGSTAASFPDKPLDDYELSVNASINAAGTGFTEIAAWFINKSGWPAKVTKDLGLRYYFTLDGTTTPSQISYTVNYNQCGANAVTGPFQASGNLYYMNVSCAGDAIYPGGKLDMLSISTHAYILCLNFFLLIHRPTILPAGKKRNSITFT